MARKNEPVRWYWPQIGNRADAIEASNAGFWAAVFCASVTALFATISIFTHSAVIGVNAGAYLDAVLFGIVAWRIRSRSKVFAVLGLCLYVVEKIYQYATQPHVAIFGIFMVIVLLLAFISGIRGTFAFHRLSAADPLLTAPQDA